LLPLVIENRDGILKVDAGADGCKVRAEYDQNRMRTRFASNPHGAFQQQFPVVGDELLGLAQAVAGSSGQEDGGDGHLHKCSAAVLTAKLRKGKTEDTFLLFLK
jgi:hypothetical protein